VSSFAIEMSAAVRLWIGSPIARIACAKALDRMMRRHVARLEMHLRGAVIVARDEAVEDLGQETALLRRQPAHDAEVDRHDAAVAVQEQVSRMHVGVEEAVAQCVTQESLHQRTPERRQVQPARFQCGAIGERRAVDPRERQHAARGALPVDRGHAEVRIALYVVAHLGDRGGLEPQIHLDRDRACECVDDLDHAQPPRLGRMPLGAARREIERVEIGLEAPLDAGPQDLDGHGLPVGLGAMHLRDGGSGNRGTERCVNFFQRLAERGGDLRLGLPLRERRHPVLQAFQIARERRADDVGARRQELTELDVSRPEPRQRGGKLDR
jgi:hypothetical protein